MTTKKCFKCNTEKLLNEFYKHPQMPDGYVNKCKMCTKLDITKNYYSNVEVHREMHMYRHRHSIHRIFTHRYHGMKNRVNGVGRDYSVSGKEIMSREDWDKWCFEEENYKKFIKMYNNWVQNNFERKLSPSVDRINPKESYTIDNIQWLTLSDNCSKGNTQRKTTI